MRRFVPCILVLLWCGFPLTSGAQSFPQWEFEGFTVELEELFTSGGNLSWMPVQVKIENTGSERIEPTVILRSTPQNHARFVTWSTVVNAGTDGTSAEVARAKVRRQILPIFIHTDESWASFVRCELEVRVKGRRVEPLDSQDLEFTLPRQPPWNNQNRLKSGNDRWFHWGHFNVLVISEEGVTDPSGWRDAFRDEIDPQLERSSGNSTIFRSAEIEALPFRQEAYQGIDRVVILGVDPERVAEPQRLALAAAVRLGLKVWIIPGMGGKGNGWAWPKELRATAPRTVIDAAGKSQPVFLTPDDPGEVRSTFRAGDDEQLPRSYRYREGTGEWLRYTSAVGSWKFSEGVSENWASSALHRTLTPIQNARGSGSGVSDPLIDEIDRRYRRSVDAEALFIFVVIYLLVAGPGLFVFLKRKGRLPWLLWLQPTVVVLFLLGTGLIGWAKFGVAGRTDHTFILYQKAGEPGGVLLHVRSVYSSVSSARDIEPVVGETLPIPIPEAVRRTPLRWNLGPGDPELSDFRTSFWSLTHFIAGQGVELGTFGTDRAGGSIVVQHSLPFDLHRLSVRVGNISFEEPRLPPGVTRTLSSVGNSDPDAFGLGAGRSIADLESTAWTGVRRQLRQWRSEGSDLRASLVAEFDPKELPAEVVGEKIDDARAFLVILVEEGNR